MLQLRPGPGYASLASWWSAGPAAGVLPRPPGPAGAWGPGPAASAHHRYAVRLGRAQYCRRAYARMEDQVLVLAPQRTGKSGLIADRIVDHPGAVLATSTRADLLATTAATAGRSARSTSSTRRASACRLHPAVGHPRPLRDLVKARRMAAWLTGGSEGTGHGNIEWFEKKGEVALAGLLFAAAVTGATITDVFRWVQLDGHQVAVEALAESDGTRRCSPSSAGCWPTTAPPGRSATRSSWRCRWAAIPALAEAVTPGPARCVRRRPVRALAAAPCT